MSIRQNSYFIVPKQGDKYTLFSDLNLKSFLEDNFFEDDLLWDGLDVKIENLDKSLSQKFTKADSWSNELNIYGNLETNCLKIIHENSTVVSITVRIDFTRDYSFFLQDIISFCATNDFVIVDSELNVLPLDYDAIHNNLINSKAYKNFLNW